MSYDIYYIRYKRKIYVNKIVTHDSIMIENQNQKNILEMSV